MLVAFNNAEQSTAGNIQHCHNTKGVRLAAYNDNNNNDRLTAFDPGQPG